MTATLFAEKLVRIKQIKTIQIYEKIQCVYLKINFSHCLWCKVSDTKHFLRKVMYYSRKGSLLHCLRRKKKKGSMQEKW